MCSCRRARPREAIMEKKSAVIALAVALTIVLPTDAAASRSSARVSASQTLSSPSRSTTCNSTSASTGRASATSDFGGLAARRERQEGRPRRRHLHIHKPRTARGGLPDHVLPPARSDRDAVPQCPATTQGRGDHRGHRRLSRRARASHNRRTPQPNRHDHFSANRLETRASGRPHIRLRGRRVAD